jgi:glyoxylase-like metal-dependent hydrolase (beta-lactamase superfamily II)
MVQNNALKVSYFASGYCISHANIIDPKHGKGKTRFYAVWALIQHPEFGNILFDTGYAPYFQAVTDNFPDRFYRWATPVFLKETETAKAILEQNGIASHQINYIIISHFHADHVAGLKDFPNAQFICTKSAYEQMAQLNGIWAVGKGILKGLIPTDFSERVLFVEDIAEKSLDKSGLVMFDLFNKNILKLVLIAGHARGMLGFYANHQLFATDASWSLDTFEKGILPRKIVKLFFDSWTDFVETQAKLRAFLVQNPATTILFTHCPETLKYIKP